MSVSRQPVLIVLVALAGVAWAWQTIRLREAGKLDLVPNIASIGRSPYGKTLAMAIQGPVDAYWHKGREPHHDHGPEHGHAEGEDGAPEDGGAGLVKAKEFLEGMEAAVVNPNTPYGQSAAHEKYLHRQIERKLEVAYWLDPGNYANFNALALFLSETALASREVNPDRVFYFADRTTDYVEAREKVNPEPWLTAASAVLAKMQWYEQLKDRIPDARARFAADLSRFEGYLNRYVFLRDLQMAGGHWEAIPVARREAMASRHLMLSKLLEAKKVILDAYFGPMP